MMNFLFLSPFFPPNAFRYCVALASRGVSVLAIGDEPIASKPPALTADVLRDYVFEPIMGDDARLYAAAAELVARHGPIARLDSNGEHWLEAEGRLRDAFGVTGLSAVQTRELRSKISMSRVFARAGIDHPKTVPGRVRPVGWTCTRCGRQSSAEAPQRESSTSVAITRLTRGAAPLIATD